MLELLGPCMHLEHELVDTGLGERQRSRSDDEVVLVGSEIGDIPLRLREGGLSHKEIGLLSMFCENNTDTPPEAAPYQDVGIQNQTLAFHVWGRRSRTAVRGSSLRLAPGLEVLLKCLLIQADTLQFRLHAAAGLKQPLPLVHAAVLGEGHVKANRAAMTGDLDRSG